MHLLQNHVLVMLTQVWSVSLFLVRWGPGLMLL